MAYFRTEWLMSLIRTSGAIESMTPRQTAAAESGPKSVRKLINGRIGAGMVPADACEPMRSARCGTGQGGAEGGRDRTQTCLSVRPQGANEAMARRWRSAKERRLKVRRRSIRASGGEEGPLLAGIFGLGRQAAGGSITLVEPCRGLRRALVVVRLGRWAAPAAPVAATAAARTSAAWLMRRWMIASISASDHLNPALGSPCRNAVRFAASPASRPRARRARYVALRLAETGRSEDSCWSAMDPAFRVVQTVRRPASPVGSVRRWWV